jgi:hypothetical protein
MATCISLYLFSGLVYRSQQWRLHAPAIANNAALCNATRPARDFVIGSWPLAETFSGAAADESRRRETVTVIRAMCATLLLCCYSTFNYRFPNAWRTLCRYSGNRL